VHVYSGKSKDFDNGKLEGSVPPNKCEYMQQLVQRRASCYITVDGIRVGDGSREGHVPPPLKKKSGKNIFRAIIKYKKYFRL